MEFTKFYVFAFISVVLCGGVSSHRHFGHGFGRTRGGGEPCYGRHGCRDRGFSNFGGNQQRFMTAQGPIEQSCLARSDQGDCEFFNCFSRRFPGCSRGAAILGNCHRICRNFNIKKEQLSQTGQRWLADSRACVMSKLKARYELTTNLYRCHEMKQAITSAMLDCMDTDDLCQAFRENLDDIVGVFKGSGRPQLSFWLGMLRKLRSCGTSLVQDIVSRMTEDLPPFIVDMLRAFGENPV